MNSIRKLTVPLCVVFLLSTTLMLSTKGASAVSPQTCGGWGIVASANQNPSYNNQLQGVISISKNDTWGVGYYTANQQSFPQTLTEHWNGIQWSVIPSPNSGMRDYLYAVAGSSTSNVWAVGDYADNSDTPQALIEQWNGTTWSVVANPAPSDSYLFGVTVISANDVWAVGVTQASSAGQTLIEHWNGTQWSIIPSPNAKPNEINELKAITAVKGSNQLWAVGYYTSGTTILTLIEQWDGQKWSIVPSPNPTGSTSNTLNAVTAVSANDVWAVGGGSAAGSGADPTLIEHWNGSTWSIVPSPNAGSENNTLFGVSPFSTNNVWAVGYAGNLPTRQTLTEHWNGVNWSIVSSPNRGSHGSGLVAVSVVSYTHGIWAVGANGNSSRTLTEFYC